MGACLGAVEAPIVDKRGKRTMGHRDTVEHRLVSRIGAKMFVVWLLFLGPIGLLFLLIVAYAMIFQNLALGIVGGLALAAPVVLGGAWVLVALYALLRSRRVLSVSPTVETAPDTAGTD
jgi:hypothetical protein